jgi:hypothetical protein
VALSVIEKTNTELHRGVTELHRVLYFYIMKITIIGTAYPYRGGLAAYNERLAKEFYDEGHEVTLLTFTLQYPGFLFPGKSQYLHLLYLKLKEK